MTIESILKDIESSKITADEGKALLKTLLLEKLDDAATGIGSCDATGMYGELLDYVEAI